MGTHWKALFKGAYLSAAELGDRTVTAQIREIRMVAMEDSKGKAEDKPVVYFHRTDRGWVLNKTNGQLLAGMFGDYWEGWVGHRVTLHAATVGLGRKKVPGIRVKGSPELDRPVTVMVELPKRKPKKHVLVPTGQDRPQRSEPGDLDDRIAAAERDGFGGEE